MAAKKLKPLNSPILPKGYYLIEGNTVRLLDGPYRGVSFEIGKLKIRSEYLTGTPQLMYDYNILDNAGFDPVTLSSDVKLSRIIGAVILDEFCSDAQNGGTIESEEWPIQESKQSSLEV